MMKIEESKKELENLHDYAQMGCSPYNAEEDNKSVDNSKQVLEETLKELEEKDRKLQKCYEIMGKDIPHCPKGYDCLYEDWMYLDGHKKECNKCWERYIDRLAEQGKL